MANAYEEAVATLFRAALGDFVSVRKQLAAELKAAGDREGSANLAKLARPTISVWVVNQLWWSARQDFEQLLAHAARLRAGDRSVATAHREALSTLRSEAATLLARGGHAATDLTLRRVSTNLAAIAAHGGFAPDLPGALSIDREPPGFESMEAALAATSPSPRNELPSRANHVLRAVPRGSAATEAASEAGRSARPSSRARTTEANRSDAVRKAEAQRAEEQRRAELEREQRREQQKQRERERRERERARERERHKLQQALHEARAALAESEREVARRRSELASAEARMQQARARTEELETRLGALEALEREEREP